jgi:hypothetical protein
MGMPLQVEPIGKSGGISGLRFSTAELDAAYTSSTHTDIFPDEIVFDSGFNTHITPDMGVRYSNRDSTPLDVLAITVTQTPDAFPYIATDRLCAVTIPLSATHTLQYVANTKTFSVFEGPSALFSSEEGMSADAVLAGIEHHIPPESVPYNLEKQGDGSFTLNLPYHQTTVTFADSGVMIESGQQDIVSGARSHAIQISFSNGAGYGWQRVRRPGESEELPSSNFCKAVIDNHGGVLSTGSNGSTSFFSPSSFIVRRAAPRLQPFLHIVGESSYCIELHEDGIRALDGGQQPVLDLRGDHRIPKGIPATIVSAASSITDAWRRRTNGLPGENGGGLIQESQPRHLPPTL